MSTIRSPARGPTSTATAASRDPAKSGWCRASGRPPTTTGRSSSRRSGSRRFPSTSSSAGWRAVRRYWRRRRPSPGARRAWGGAFVGVTVSPLLLIKDLGKPSRFLYMLRVFKPTSPMSVGAWLLAANGGATSLAAGLNLLDEDRRGGAPELLAAALGAPLATYTAALVTHSAIPAWSEARKEMPFVFAASATASAAGAAILTVPADEAEPARRLGVLAAIAEEGITIVMHRRLGPLADAYEKGTAGKFGKAARALTAAGAAAFVASDPDFPLRMSKRRRSLLSMTGGTLLLAGSVAKRWSVFKAGFQSAEDPTQTIETQRERIGRLGNDA